MKTPTVVLKNNIHKARKDTDTNPSKAQIDAENYKKGKFQWNGLTIRLENPKGSIRSGISDDGKEWSIKMKYDYGYIGGNTQKGKDGDAVDVFIGHHPDSNVVYVIDQMLGGKFDEHKCVIGAKSKEEAKKVYLANYEDGWKCGPITAMTIDHFKEWVKKGNTGKPVSEMGLFKVSYPKSPDIAPKQIPEQISKAPTITEPIKPPREHRAPKVKAKVTSKKIPSVIKKRLKQYNTIFDNAAKKYGIDPHLLKSVGWQESDFRPNVVSSAGASGLVQLMPGTANILEVKNIFDPTENVSAGAEHLRDLNVLSHDIPDKFRQDIVLSKYNYGGGNINKMIRKYEGNFEKVLDNLPDETRRYVKDIKSKMRLIGG